MKKVIVILLLCAAIFPLAATPLFQIGGLVFFDKGVSEIEGSDFLDIGNYSFGLDVRFNPISFISLDIPATMQFSKNMNSYELSPSLNLNIDIAGYVDIAAGVGFKMDFMTRYYYSYGIKYRYEYLNGYFDKAEGFINSPLFYRFALTGNIGMVGIGAICEVPIQGTFKDFSLSPDFEQSRFGLAVMLNM